MALPTADPALLEALAESVMQGQQTGQDKGTVFGDDDITNMEMTNTIAEGILVKLQSLVTSESTLTIHDMKDIVSMFKDVGTYVHKSSGDASTTSGLDVFVKRLKA